MSKIFIIACEASGDQHGADLIRSLKKLDPTLEFEGLGGLEMQKAGAFLLEDMTQISVLGLGDVLRKYFRFRKIFYRALKEVKTTKPDLLILIDSPAFNLRFAKKISRKIPVIYYISPQIWAWGWRRIHTIRKVVDHMIVILPFEEEIYRNEKIPCTFVGHPLLDQVKSSKSRPELRSEFGLNPAEKMIALLPGSREPEVRRILPISRQDIFDSIRPSLIGSCVMLGMFGAVALGRSLWHLVSPLSTAGFILMAGLSVAAYLFSIFLLDQDVRLEVRRIV